MPAEDAPMLCRDKRVAIVTYDDIKHLKIRPTAWLERQPAGRKAELKERLATIGCDAE